LYEALCVDHNARKYSVRLDLLEPQRALYMLEHLADQLARGRSERVLVNKRGVVDIIVGQAVVVYDDKLPRGFKQLPAFDDARPVRVDDNDQRFPAAFAQRFFPIDKNICVIIVICERRINGFDPAQHAAHHDTAVMALLRGELPYADRRAETILVHIRMAHDDNVPRNLHQLFQRVQLNPRRNAFVGRVFRGISAEKHNPVPVLHQSLIPAAPQRQIHRRLRVFHRLRQRRAVFTDAEGNRDRHIAAHFYLTDLLQYLEVLFYQFIKTALRQDKQEFILFKFTENGGDILCQHIYPAVDKRDHNGPADLLDRFHHVVEVVYEYQHYHDIIHLSYSLKARYYG
jgi:hypothetical protein